MFSYDGPLFRCEETYGGVSNGTYEDDASSVEEYGMISTSLVFLSMSIL